MKKLWTILILCLVFVFCAVGFAACGDDKTEPEPEPAAPTSVAMTKDEFLTELGKREAATFADANLKYATVDCTYVEHSDREINADGTYKITYGNGYAYVSVEYEQAHSVQQHVLGLSSGLFNYMPEEILSALKLVKDGDNLEMSFDAVREGFRCTGKYVFDENGYVIYASESESGDGYSGSVEFTVKTYNKKNGETVDYTVNSEQWDKAVSLSWTNVTYEYTDGHMSQKIELLENGGMHQYAGVGGGWGEVYAIYVDDMWKVYQGESTTVNFTYDTKAAYIAGSYGDDFGFMQSMLPMISGRMDEFTFDSTNNQYLAENIGIQMGGPEDVYPMNVTAKFENQKLVYVKFAAVGGDEYMEANFWNYGTTVINYPDYILNA